MIRYILIGVLLTGFAWAESSVWKVTDGKRSFYVGGTFHLLRDEDLPLPDEFEKAYRDCDELVFEVDMQEFAKPEFQARLMRAVMMDEGEKLSDFLEQETFLLMAAACREMGFPVQFVERMQPSMAVMTVTVMKMKQMGFSETQGVDILFDTRARRDQKPISGLETPEQQVSFLAGMGKGYEDAFVKKSLRDLQEIDQQLPPLVKAWRSGNLEGIAKVMIGEMKGEYPKVYQDLLVERNADWMPMLNLQMEDPETEFILVGAMHLPGPDGLLNKFTDEGYTVEPLVLKDEK